MSDSMHCVGQAQVATSLPAASEVDSINVLELLAEKGREVSAPPKLYRIGEVIQHSGFSRQTIHNYTAMGLIRESQWTQTGHRLYDESVFRYLALIKELRTRYSLAQIKEMLGQVSAS